MNIYVAGKWEEMARVREVQAQLRAVGHRITHDWTSYQSDSPRDQAICDLTGVRCADVLVLIVEKDLRYAGAWVEMGIAIGRGIPVYVLGTAGDQNIFMNLPRVYRGIDSLLELDAPVLP